MGNEGRSKVPAGAFLTRRGIVIHGIFEYFGQMKNRLCLMVMACFCAGQLFAQDHAFFMPASSEKIVEPPASDTTWMMDANDQLVSFRAFLEKNRGKVIYLDFWASWCAPCMAEMPYSASLRKKLKKEDVVFAYISIDEEKTSWTKAATRNRLAGEQNFRMMDFRHAALVREFGIGSIPRYIIIGKDGEIMDMDATGPSDRRTFGVLKELAKKN